MKTLIVGQARTGTSAVFFYLQAALPPDTCCLFEPVTLEGTGWATAQHSLVKTLVASLPGDDLRLSLDPTLFDRRLVLVRDPRDRLISLLLFLPHWQSGAYPPLCQCNTRGLEAYLTLLRQKVTAPGLVPVWELFEQLMALRFGFTHGEARPTLQHLQQTFIALHTSLHDCETIHYETLTPPDESEHNPRPPRAYARIVRRGGAGEWRQWFTL